MINTLGKEVYASGPLTEWVVGELVFHLFYFYNCRILAQYSCNVVSLLPKAAKTQSKRPSEMTMYWLMRLPVH